MPRAWSCRAKAASSSPTCRARAVLVDSHLPGRKPCSIVGRLAVEDGKGTMVDWTYVDGADVMPDDGEVQGLRPSM